ncbi:MAG: hypothetical protein JNJ50_14695 [Acidobacteria bacterium]|nr:hypothetical protein [Acidobacteriota bacterium]
MKAQQNRLKVGPPSTTRRRASSPAVRISASSKRSARTTRSSRAHKSEPESGTNVLWILMVVGGLVATGFIFALRSQINVYHLGQTESQLKTELDRLSDHQRYLALEQQRALSVRESDLAAKQSGLIQPKLNQAGPAPVAPVASTTVAASNARPAAKPVTNKAPTTIAKAQPKKEKEKPAKSLAVKTQPKNNRQQLALVRPAVKTKKDTPSQRPVPRALTRR